MTKTYLPLKNYGLNFYHLKSRGEGNKTIKYLTNGKRKSHWPLQLQFWTQLSGLVSPPWTFLPITSHSTVIKQLFHLSPILFLYTLPQVPTHLATRAIPQFLQCYLPRLLQGNVSFQVHICIIFSSCFLEYLKTHSHMHDCLIKIFTRRGTICFFFLFKKFFIFQSF